MIHLYCIQYLLSLTKSECSMEKFKYYKQVIWAIILAGLMVLIALRISDIGAAIRTLGTALVPLILGGCIAFVLDILVVRYERWLWPTKDKGWKEKIRRPISIILSFLTVSLIMYFIARMAVPQLIHSLSLIVAAIPQLYVDFQLWIHQMSDTLGISSNPTIMEALNDESIVQYSKELGTKGGTYIVNTMGDILSWTFNLFLGLIFAIYMLLDKERLLGQCQRILRAYVSNTVVDRLNYFANVAIETFSNFFVGQFIDALLLGIAVGVTLWGFDVSYAMTLACVIGLTGLIPMLGIYIGGIMGVIILLTVSPMEALIYVIIIEVLHQIESNFVYPKIVGNSVGLPGLWVFAAVIIGTSLAGLIGMLVGVPLAATLYKLLREDVARRLAAQNTL